NLDGISMAATLSGVVQEARPFLYREFRANGGQQSLRMGNWKAIRQNLMPSDRSAKPDLEIQLYNLAADVRETTEAAREDPEVVEKMAEIMRQQHVPSAEFPLPALD